MQHWLLYASSLYISELGGESPNYQKSCHNSDSYGQEGEPNILKMDMMPTCFPEDCTGCTYPNEPDEDSQHFKASIMCKIEEHDDKANQHPAKHQFWKQVSNSSPTRMLNVMASRKIWRLEHMIGQQGPLQLWWSQVQEFELQCEGGIGRWMYYM